MVQNKNLLGGKILKINLREMLETSVLTVRAATPPQFNTQQVLKVTSKI